MLPFAASIPCRPGIDPVDVTTYQEDGYMDDKI